MFIKTVYNVKECRYVLVDWCMSKEECKIGRYHDETLEAGVSSVLEEFDCFDFVGVHNTYESLMVDVLDYSLENEECDFDLLTLIMNCQQNLTIIKKQLVSFSAMELVKAGCLILNNSI